MQNYFIEKKHKFRNCVAVMHNLKNTVVNAVEKAVDTVLPPRCPVSGDMVDMHGMISAETWKGLEFVSAPFCEKCGIPFDFDVQAEGNICVKCLEKPPAFDTARSALIYNDTSRGMILGFKHGDKIHAAKSFVPWLKRSGQEMIDQADFIIPVPLHRFRLLRRRYNQAAIMGYELSKETGITHAPLALRRIRATASQGHLKTDERAKNVRKAFALRDGYEEKMKDKNIILIDDVYTTGATVSECTKILKRAGAGRVDVLTLARVVKD